MSSMESRVGGEATAPFDFSRFPQVIDLEDGVVLNSFQPDDAEAFEALAKSDEAIQKYIPWANEDKALYIDRVTKNRASRGPRYAVRLNDNLAGHVAVFPSDDKPGVIEFGYVLDKSARGLNILDRAIPTCEALVEENMPGTKTALCIDDANTASQRVAVRLGYVPTDEMSGTDRLYLKGEL